MKMRSRLAAMAATLMLGFAGLPSIVAAELSEGPAAAPFTVVVMPDTQKYVELYPRGLASQVEWIRKNRDRLNCKFVIHEGDIVQNPGNAAEWAIADAAFRQLDGRVPYAFSVGNHDMVVAERDKSLFRETFPRERFASMPTFGGSQNAHADNSYHLLEIGALKFLVLTLEFSPDDACLTWANEVVAAHPNHRVIVDTHSYLNVNERNDVGKVIWEKFVRKHPNIFLVLCGHLSVGRRVARGDHGNVVHEVLANYQGLPNGGNGWLRLLHFHPAENRIEVRTYSTLLNRYMREGDPKWSRLSDNHFHLPYLMSGPVGFSELSFRAVEETADPKELYEESEVEGWQVWLHEDLARPGSGLKDKILGLLREQLRAVKRRLPERALQELLPVPLWVERAHPSHDFMVYHPDRETLLAKGMNPEKAGSIEIAHAERFLEQAAGSPRWLLKYMARAYHHRRLGWEHAGVQEAFAVDRKALAASEQGDPAESGEERVDDGQAYFASLSAAYWAPEGGGSGLPTGVRLEDLRGFQALSDWWAEAPLKARLLESRKIWDAGKHNAFTDLVAWRGKRVCAFREGEKHAGDQGQLRVLLSGDEGASWQSAAVIRQEGGDLRDAKLAVTPDDRLMLVGGLQREEAGKRVTHTVVSFSSDGYAWSLPERIGEPGRWLWGVTWAEDRAYGVAYPTPQGAPYSSLMMSHNGREFETLVAQFVGEGRPTEAVVRRFRDGRYWCLHRRDGSPAEALLGSTDDPAGPWKWKTLNRRIGGPGLIEIPSGEMIGVVRLYDGGARTEVCVIEPEQARITPLLRLPSGGDTSYPGLVWQNDHLLITYYSSHEGKTSIYMARVAFDS